MAASAHIPVLADSYISLLCHNVDGQYVDATFGRGGHARMLLATLSPQGKLLGLDRDPEAVAVGRQLEAEDSRFQMIHADFSDLQQAMEQAGWSDADGIGFDLGVSSPQLDQAERGFSFKSSGPLDMRMDMNHGQSLAQKLQRTSEKELAHIIRSYGDERFSSRIARRIMQAVHDDLLHNTADLENICFHAVPPKARHGHSHPATRTFQALRIWVNDEYEQIKQGVTAAMQVLRSGGHLAVISFHSGEDRRVRDLIQAEVQPCTCPPQFPMCICGRSASMRWLQKKPLRATEAELGHNPRSRSALLRAAECIRAESSTT